MKKDDMSDAFKKAWEKIKSLRYVLIVVAAGVILLMLPDGDKTDGAETESPSYTCLLYTSLLSSMVGRASCVIQRWEWNSRLPFRRRI